MRRFIAFPYLLGYAPRPGEREIRLRPPKDRAMNRPKEESNHV